jgi:hypothetical protein
MSPRERPPETLGDLVAVWRRRAADREAAARRLSPLGLCESRVMQADAAAVRQCANELLQLMTGLR